MTTASYRAPVRHRGSITRVAATLVALGVSVGFSCAKATTPVAPPAPVDELIPEIGNPAIDVEHYDVRLDIADDGASFDGQVTLTLVTRVAAPTISLDAVGLAVSTVTVDGAEATFVTDDHRLTITPATPPTAGQQLEVGVRYRFELASSPTTRRIGPSGLGWFATDEGTFVLNEPDGARTWLPSNDHPTDRATWQFALTVASGVEAIANGRLVRREHGQRDTWSWREDAPMATYVVQVLTGQYTMVGANGPGGTLIHSVGLELPAPEDSSALLDQCAALTVRQIEFFEGMFGPYPFAQYGLAITPSPSGLAMEMQTRSQFSDRDLTSCDDGDVIGQLLTAHELAHQWFGNGITLAEWSDIWLNESFATYLQWLWFDHIGLATLDSQAADGLATRGTRPTGAPSVDDLFGTNSYDGGAVVLQALRLTIGDEAFFTVMRRWVQDNLGRSLGTADFIALTEQVSVTDLDSFFDTWLFSGTVPTNYPGR